MMNSYHKYRVNRILPYFILFFVALYIHSFWQAGGDDVWFATILNNRTVGEYYVWRYQTWSSRLVVESMLIFLCRSNIWLWRVCDSAIIVLLVYSIVELIKNKRNEDEIEVWTVMGLVVFFPYIYMSSAGWIATSLNYLWPLALGLYGLIPIKNVLNGEETSLFTEISVLPALLYASNTEQMAAILFVVYLIVILYYYIKSKRFSKELIINFIIVAINLGIVLTCTGNAQRTIAEMHWFPNFEQFLLLQKIIMSFVTTTIQFWYEANSVYFIYTIILMIGVWLRNKSKIHRMIGAIPFVYYVFCSKGLEVIFRISPSLEIYSPFQYISQVGFSNYTYYMYAAINLILVLINIICYYLIFKKEYHFYIISLILLAGIASRLVVGLSPTFFASGERTAIYFVFSLIGNAGYLLLNYIYEKLNNPSLVSVFTCILVIVGFESFFYFGV